MCLKRHWCVCVLLKTTAGASQIGVSSLYLQAHVSLSDSEMANATMKGLNNDPSDKHILTHTQGTYKHRHKLPAFHNFILFAGSKGGTFLSLSLSLLSLSARSAAGLRNVWEPCVKSPDCGKVLLSAELPPPTLSPSLRASFPRSLSLILLDCFPGKLPVPLQPCASVCACVRACMCLHALQHTGSEWRLSASEAQPGIATSCSYSFYANTKLSTTHTHIFALTKTTSTTPHQEQPRRSTKEGGSFSVCLSLYPVSLSLSLPLEHKHRYLSHTVYTTFIYLRIQNCGCKRTHSPVSEWKVRYGKAKHKKFTKHKIYAQGKRQNTHTLQCCVLPYS